MYASVAAVNADRWQERLKSQREAHSELKATAQALNGRPEVVPSCEQADLPQGLGRRGNE